MASTRIEKDLQDIRDQLARAELETATLKREELKAENDLKKVKQLELEDEFFTALVAIREYNTQKS